MLLQKRSPRKTLMPDIPDVAIAGIGLMGSLLGWRLARLGYRVELFEAGCAEAPAAAGYTAAAMVAPWSELPVCDPALFAMGKQSLQLWPSLLDDLYADTGERIVMGRKGSLIVAHPADHSELLDFGRFMQRHQMGAGQGVHHLDRWGIQELEPLLSDRFAEGFWLEHEAHIENRPLLALLQRAIVKFGGTVHYQTPVSFVAADANNHVITDVITDGMMNAMVDGQIRPAGLWIDSCGVGAKPWTSGLRGVRGEVIWIEAGDVQISRPVRLLHPRYHLYLVPKSNGRYILGATEIESEDRSPVSVRSALEMLSALYSICPALAEARVLEMSSNLRPALFSHVPVIRRQEGYLSVNGLFRHGYLLAPALLARIQQQAGLHLGLAGLEYSMLEEELI
jgi:glycine oxidase